MQLLVIAKREATKPSICVALDCFAEPVIGRRFAPTCWLARTNVVAIPQQKAPARCRGLSIVR